MAQQLAISRDLTQKLKSTDSASEDENVELEIDNVKNDSSNPWVNGIKPDQEVNDFVSGFRKYWQEHNKNILENSNTSLPKNISRKIENVEKPCEMPKKNEKTKTKTRKYSQNHDNQLNSSASTSEWEVSPINNETIDVDFEKIFETLEDKMNKKIKTDYRKVKNLTKVKKNKQLNKKKTITKQKIDLTMKPSSQKQIIDEELLETTTDITQIGNEQSTNTFKNIIKGLNTVKDIEKAVDINPEKFIEIKKTDLQTAIPDVSVLDDNQEENGNQKDLILEAFEDDDIADDFKKDKADIIREDTPKDIDLTLPGWGSWAGSGIKPTKRKNKRLIFKMPPAPPRKDENKGSLIINEKAQSKIKSLLVSEIPFPFKTVKDYEAAIRAPIGNTFVPERAFKKFIEPNVTTKMGTIIEPITRSILMGKKSV